MVQHRSLTNITLTRQNYALKPGERQLQFLSPTFDAAVEEFYPTLCSGATLVMHPQPTELSPAELLDVIERHGVTVTHSPAAYLHQLIEELWASGRHLPAGLRLLITGAERPALEKLSQLQQRSAPTLRLINSYGPTETTVTATSFEWSRAETALHEFNSLPIGRPIANVHVYIFDKQLRPIPIRARGELYISGAGVARGYLNAAAETAEKFIPHPFATTPGQRLYRTGDFARHLATGDIEF